MFFPLFLNDIAVQRSKKHISWIQLLFQQFRLELLKNSAILKFIYSEKATKFFEISTVDLSYVVTVKSTVEISQNFVAFSEYKNFIYLL